MNKKFNNSNFFRFVLTFFVILISLSIIFVSFADKKLIAGDAITIFLDPGHGGSDYGCIHNGLNEKEINLKIALKLKGLLESNGFRVIIRRTSDEGKSLDEVVNMANSSGADLFLSIHNNASLSPESAGTETYWSANGVPGSSQFAASIQSSLVSEIGRPNRGVKTADFKVIKNTGITAALVECVFLSNPDEANLLKDDGFLSRIANGLFNGISNYARNITPGNSTAGGTYKATKVLVNIDEPTNSQTIGGNFELKGWAVEESGINSPEITAVHVYDGPAAGAENMVGIATYCIARPDVAQSFGKANFTNCGFTLGVDSSRLAKGTHVLYVYAHNEQLGWAYTTVKVNVLNDGSNVGNQDNSISTPVQGTVETNTTNTTNNSTSNQNYNSSGTQKVLINIDSLKNNQQVSGSFELAGWAVEQSAINSTGITAIHVYDGPANGEPNMLGVATYGIPRKDVADYFGKNNLTNCGFKLSIDGSKLSNGVHTLYIYAYNQNLGWKYTTIAINYNGSSNTSNNNQSTTSSSTTNTSANTSTTSSSTTNTSTITNTSYASSGQPKALINVDLPSPNQQLSGDLELAGWAVEQSAMDSTGITAIHVYDGPANGEPNMLGVAQYGIARPDVASNFGKANFTNCGFKLIVNSSKLTNGKHTLYVYAYNPNLGWKYVTVAINYAGSTSSGSTSSGSTSSVSGGTVITNSTSMVGYYEVTVDQLVSIFINRGSTKVEWAKRLAPIYIQYGKLFNIRVDIAWAMMCHETGFLEFTGDVKPNQNNFVGIGATGGGVPGDSFATEELGIIAHYAHLAWYYYPTHINEYCSKQYDPRHFGDTHTRYTGDTTLGFLNGRWAPSNIYTDKILLFANRIYGN